MDCSLRARIRNPSPAASHFSGEGRLHQASRVSFRAMASAVPVEEPAAAAEAKPRPTGDSFIRHHLRSLSAYQPILPFEVSLQLLHLPAPWTWSVGNAPLLIALAMCLWKYLLVLSRRNMRRACLMS
jgi:hypothetical protein